MRGAAVVVASGLLAAAACGGGSTTAERTATTVRPTTTERRAPSPPLTRSTTTLVTTTTLPERGLPSSFPVFPADVLTLTGASTQTQRLSIAGVNLDEVHRWFLEGLVDAGYEITADHAPQAIEFHSPGSDGVVTMADRGDGDNVDITIEQFASAP